MTEHGESSLDQNIDAVRENQTIERRGEQALLVAVEGQEGTARFVGNCRIGRAPDNDLVVESRSVSLYHAEAVLEGGSWRLRDLGSTNGTIVGGRRIESITLGGPTRVHLGVQGPTLTLTPEGLEKTAEAEPTLVPSESAIVRRYFAPRAPKNIGTHTAALRRAFANLQRRRTRKYAAVLLAVATFGLAASSYAYLLHKRMQRQRSAAEELFYASKDIELALAKLAGSVGERQVQQARHAEFDKQYQDFLKELGIYSDATPEEVQLVYRVAHRFGESEVNVPQDFVDAVLTYVRLWKTSPRLKDAMERAQRNGYGRRIAKTMLEHGLPPEFFYLALQESDLRVEATGPETRYGIAKGMWQFVPGTARDYGLKTGPLVGVRRPDSLDERHDFEKSTRAAARYLRRIYTTDAQASGLLVIASYNWGESNILRLVRSLPENPRERNFWQLLDKYRELIPQETYDYVFSIVSAAVIGEDPELFGFDFDPPYDRPEILAASGE
jgi:pSer/pThr/pTyr-binding forkhead associated (FHA) protein